MRPAAPIGRRPTPARQRPRWRDRSICSTTFDAFKGTGSYFFGMQAGYNYVLPSHWLIGFEADASAPNTLAGSQTLTTPADGLATYNDTVLNFGTARARIGYDFNRCLVYGTGGLAWSYDRLQRTQLAGGIVAAGTTETALPVADRLGRGRRRRVSGRAELDRQGRISRDRVWRWQKDVSCRGAILR